MILQGNSIRIPLRDESVHAIVTSFPYYGLRSYGLPPTIWGGDSRCQHVWATHQHTPQPHGDNGLANSGLQGGKATQGKTRMGEIESAFCQLCGAWLGCFGLEPTIGLHVQNAVAVCREIKRVLRKDGVFWLNYGDSYATGKNGRSAADTKAAGKDDRTFRDKPFSVTELPAKNLCGIPWRVALALQDDGWILRSEIPWLKANAMPSSVTDRPGTAHEYVFMLVKSARYYYDGESVRRGTSSNKNDGRRGDGGKYAFKPTNPVTHFGVPNEGRALRTSDPFFDGLDAYIAHLQDVRDNGGMLVDEEGLPAALVVNTASFKGAHYATFAPKLIAPLIKTTPEKVCPNCGNPWVRVVVASGGTIGRSWHNHKDDLATGQRAENAAKGGNGYKRETLGWKPTCKCIQKRAPNFGMKGSELLELADEVIKELAPIGGIILDPFVGSGTVIAVAKEHGRRGIGIDLSAEYLQTNALPRAERLTSQKSLAQLPMFSDHLQAAIEIVTEYLIEELNLREDEAA